MFKDVNKNSYAAEAIEYCRKNGIIAGFPDGTFRPLEPVTREQMAVLLYKILKQDGVFKDVIPEIMPSVVLVMAGAGIGSGVCFKYDNGLSYILTNNHVATAGNKYTIIKSGYNNTPAQVTKTDPVNDLAIMTTSMKLQPCKIAATPAHVGQPVCVIGSPGGYSDSVTVGIVSHANRNDGKWFQTDAPINPGNSGGGIFNEYGELVGIAVAKAADPLFDGMGYGIRLEHVKKIIKGV